MSRANQNLEELYKVTLKNLEQMKDLACKKAKNGEDSSMYDELIERLNKQYNNCKDNLDKLYESK